MDVERQRIEEDLRGQIAGEVRCDDLFVRLYASDASVYEITPLGVVRPRGIDDVVATVRYADEYQIPLHPRGSGSGLAGESLGPGLIVDFSRYMRRVIEVSEDTVTVQPGVVLGVLNDQLARSGRMFGPDPATKEVTTLGSMIAVDTTGSHWPAYGCTRQHVESLEVILANGQQVRMSTHDIPGATEKTSPSSLGPLLRGVDAILRRYEDSIASGWPKSQVNSGGYRLDEVRRNGQLDLSRLLAGSEGTLGLIVEATVKTVALPSHVGSVLLFVVSIIIAGVFIAKAEAIIEILKQLAVRLVGDDN